MSINRQQKNKKDIGTKRWQKALLACVLLVPLATGIAPVLADSSTPVSAQSAGIKVKVDDSVLQKAIADAKAAGMTITQDKSAAKTVNFNQFAETQKSILSDYQSQVDKINALVQKQIDLNNQYVKSKAAYDVAKAQYDKDKLAYDAGQAQYDKDKVAYKTALAQYDKAKAAYDKSIAEQKANTTKDGFAKIAIVQALQLGAEGNAKVSVYSNDNLTFNNNGKQQSTPTIHPVSEFRTNPNSGKNSKGEQVEFYETSLKKGQSIEMTYDNLVNSSYNNRKITKLVRTLSYGSNGNDDQIGLAIADDPTVGFWYIGGSAPSGTFERSVDVVDKYYYKDGTQVEFKANNAYFSVGSLNNYYGGTNNEHIERVKVPNSTFLPINGSSITDNNGWYNSKKDNSTGVDGGLTASDWDKNSSPKSYYGAAIYSLDNGVKDISYTASTIESADDGGKNKTSWFTQSTTLPVEAAIIPPNKPTEPTEPKAPIVPKEPEKPASLSASYKLEDLYVIPTPQAPETPNTSYGEKPKGALYASIAALTVGLASLIFYKPIKKWLQK